MTRAPIPFDTAEPRLYTDLAGWWPLLSAPADYVEEAAFYRRVLADAVSGPLERVLECCARATWGCAW